MSRVTQRAGAIALGLVADRLLPEPANRVHPVAGFGAVMGLLESRIWRDRVASGAAYTVAGTALGAVAGRLVGSTGAATAAVVAASELRRVGENVIDTLEREGLPAPRTQLRALVGRDPSELDESGVAAAVIESLSENMVDAVVAPVFWGLVAGAPGAVAYRAVNTMDAMVGHRSETYERFGKVSARLDDVANWIPARLTAGLFAAVTPGRRAEVFRIVRRDSRHHPSPNAGVAEAAAAAALGVKLGGPLRYGTRDEDRPVLGAGPRPRPAQAREMIALLDRSEAVLVGLLLTAWAMGRLRR